jgi:hypothetical protein
MYLTTKGAKEQIYESISSSSKDIKLRWGKEVWEKIE